MKILNTYNLSNIATLLKLYFLVVLANVFMLPNVFAKVGWFEVNNATQAQLNCTLRIVYTNYNLFKQFSINSNQIELITTQGVWGDFQRINLNCNGHEAQYERGIDSEYFTDSGLFPRTLYPQVYPGTPITWVRLDILGLAVEGPYGPCEHSYIGFYTLNVADSNSGIAKAKWLFSS